MKAPNIEKFSNYYMLLVSCYRKSPHGRTQAAYNLLRDEVRQGKSAEARAIVEAERHEMALFEKYGSCYSYGVYVAKRFPR